jgi:hypothetical protein
LLWCVWSNARTRVGRDGLVMEPMPSMLCVTLFPPTTPSQSLTLTLAFALFPRPSFAQLHQPFRTLNADAPRALCSFDDTSAFRMVAPYLEKVYLRLHICPFLWICTLKPPAPFLSLFSTSVETTPHHDIKFLSLSLNCHMHLPGLGNTGVVNYDLENEL